MLFLRGLTHIIVPYIMMESAYIVASSVLGIEPLLAPLTPILFFKTLFFAPVGPYWFLHTLFLCALISYFCTQKLVRKPLFSMLAQFVLVFFIVQTHLIFVLLRPLFRLRNLSQTAKHIVSAVFIL